MSDQAKLIAILCAMPVVALMLGVSFGLLVEWVVEPVAEKPWSTLNGH